MTRPCRDVETALGRPAHTLSEAERLHLEQHLSECDECRQGSAVVRAVGELICAAPSRLSESARERAIAGAFARAARVLPRPRSLHWGQRAGLAVAAAALLLVGVRVWLLAPERGELVAGARSGTAGQPATDSTPRAANPPPSPLSVASDDGWIESARGDTRELASARVTLAAGTRVRFERVANTLELARGEVTLDVDHQHERPFVVLTQGFRVEVLGTQFVVSPEHVSVLRGHVLVRARASAELLGDLQAGQSYRHPATAPETAAASDTATSETHPPTHDVLRRARPVERGDVGRGTSAALPEAVAVRPPAATGGDSASELIAQVRAALARDDVSQARSLLQRATRAARQLGERAEVGTLEAECELLARRPKEAARAYLRVADRFAALSAGENALFAAAQLRLRERDTGAARALFERYLTRYPEGRFVDEARAHLAPSR